MKNQDENTNSKSKQFCAISFISEILGNHWVLLIINQLLSGSKRFSVLQENINGINTCALTDKLKMLENRKLINRKVFAEVPLRVEYSLTDQGKALSKIIEEMSKFSNNYYSWCVENEITIDN
jgi:DNA-binding HxlR family transcriptional regulator